MDLEVHWAGRHPARIGRLHQDAAGTVFLKWPTHAAAHGIPPWVIGAVAAEHRVTI